MDTKADYDQLLVEMDMLRQQNFQLRLAENALRESEEWFRLLYMQAPVPYQSLDRDGHILEVNPAWLAELGYERDEVIGRWFGDFLAGDNPDMFRQRFPLFKERGETHNTVFEMRCKDGRSITVTFDGRIGHDERGQFLQTHCVFNNITERQKAEKALRASETRFRAIYENSVDAISVSIAGTYVGANPAYLQMFNYEHEDDLIGRSVLDLIAPTDRARVADNIARRARREYAPTIYEMRGLRRDGSELDVEMHISIYDLNGEQYTLAILRDVTERKRIECAEREQRAFADALVKTAEAINGTLDFDEVLTRILDAIGEVIPHDGANIMLIAEGEVQVVGYCDCYRQHGLDVPKVGVPWPLERLPHLQRMIDSGQPFVIPDTVQYPNWAHSNNRAMLRSYVGAPIWSGDQVIGLINVDSVTPDFFSGKHAERLKAFANQAALAVQNARMFQKLSTYSQDLEKAVLERTSLLTTAYTELEVLTRVKDDFVSNVSHELRSPLTSLMLRQSLLRRFPDKVDEHMAVIERETKRLQHTIDDLLRLSRLDQGRTDINLHALDLNQAVEQFVQDRKLIAEEAGLDLSFVACEEASQVMADPGLVGQVLGILVTNAINYTPAGGSVIARICRGTDGRAGFSIEDTGPGISHEDQARLFERFFRGSVGQQSKRHGTGLGLAIAKEIITLHGGQIGLESEPGQGAVFTVWLPVFSI